MLFKKYLSIEGTKPTIKKIDMAVIKVFVPFGDCLSNGSR
jgi:hypothetical protein